MSSFSFVDLFCCAGGASEGARQAGLRVALAVDACPHAISAHKKNHPDCMHICEPLPLPDGRKLPLPPGRIHIHASPPCQAVSKANMDRDAEKREGATHLIEWCVRFCQEHGTTWSLEQVATPVVLRLFDGMGIDYGVFHFDKMGLPQKRRRLVAGSPSVLTALREAERSGKRVSVYEAMRGHCPTTHIRNHASKFIHFEEGIRKYTPGRHLRHVSMPSYCVVGRPLLWTSEGNWDCTALSVDQSALLQSFPKGYSFDDQKGIAYRQIGNALPPMIGKIMFEAARRTA